MSHAISCPACLKRFSWTPKVAGKRVTCHCGQKFITPDVPGGPVIPIYETEAADLATERPERETYDLADEPDTPAKPQAAGQPERPAVAHAGRCPNCNAPVKPDARLCVRCGFDLAAGEKLRTEVAATAGSAGVELGPEAGSTPGLNPGPIPGRHAPDPLSHGTSPIARALANREDEFQPSVIRETVAPLAMTALGFAGVVALSLYDTTSWLQALGHFGLNLGSAVLSICAVILAMTAGASVLGLAFGELKAALLKALGVGLLGSFAADTITLLVMPLVLMLGVHGIVGIVCVAAALNVFLVGLPLLLLFELEFNEALLVSIFLLLIKAAGFFVMLAIVGVG